MRDIAAARHRFGIALGITFGPVESRVLNFTNGESDNIRLCYSVEGPPYLELIEANGAGVFGLQHPEGVHHIGAWVTDGPSHCAALQAQGVGVDRQLQSSDGPYGRSQNFMWFNDPAHLHGVRFEFVDDSMRAALEERFATGRETPD